MSKTWILVPLTAVATAPLVACPGDDCTRTATCEVASGGGGTNAGGSTSSSGGANEGGGGANAGGGGNGGEGGAPVLPTALGLGGNHSCHATSGSLSCWGNNDYYQLGTTAPTSSVSPLGVQLTGVVDVAAGVGHTCALLSDGTVWCWGQGNYGELGNGSQDTSAQPVKVITLDNVEAIEAGDDHTCALLGDGTAYCWGLNGDGQLGDGSSVTVSSSPVQVAIQGIERLSDDATCAIVMGGSLWCWGRGSSTPSQVASINDAVDVCRGFHHTCVSRESGEVWCWGDNDVNQLGYEGVPQGGTSAPTAPVVFISTAEEVACGRYHTCALLANSTLRCWGEPGDGQLGNGMETHTEEAWEPETPIGLDNVASVAAGNAHTCATRADGTVWCWGNNALGQAGVDGVTNQYTPLAVDGL